MESGGELTSERVLRRRINSLLFAPGDVGFSHVCVSDVGVFPTADDQPVFNEPLEGVLAGLIVRGRLTNHARGFQALGEVAYGPVHDPLEDAGSLLVDELLGEVVDPFSFGDGVREGDEAHAPPEAVAAGLYFRLVVAEEGEAVGGGEFEEVAVHPPGCDPVPAGELFDFHFVEDSVFWDFACEDEAFAVEACEFGGVLAGGAGEEVCGGCARVVGEEGLEDVCEDALTVRSSPVVEGQDLFAY